MTLANAFIGKAKKPTDSELEAALGVSKALWDQLIAKLKQQFGLKGEWNSYSAKAGWSLRMKDGERNIVYLTPGKGALQASFALGDKAVKAALASGLPGTVIKLIKEAKRYAEGTAVRMEVRNSADVAVVVELAAIKLEN